MAQYIDKDVLVAEIEKLKKSHDNWSCMGKCFHQEYDNLLSFIDTLEVKEVDLNKKIDKELETRWRGEYLYTPKFRESAKYFFELDPKIQYANIEQGIKAHAENYSFNIESELYNQLTKEQQTLWRKEIEQAVISGGEEGIELARDLRYKENIEVKEVDLEKELKSYIKHRKAWVKGNSEVEYNNGDSFNHIYDLRDIAKHFFELGFKAQKL